MGSIALPGEEVKVNAEEKRAPQRRDLRPCRHGGR